MALIILLSFFSWALLLGEAIQGLPVRALKSRPLPFHGGKTKPRILERACGEITYLRLSHSVTPGLTATHTYVGL